MSDYTLPPVPEGEYEHESTRGVKFRTHSEIQVLSYAEAARAPLLARIADLEASLYESSVAGMRMVRAADDEIDRLRAEVEALTAANAALRADAVIEWEPGRSYTAAELLRRAIQGLRVRKGRPVWPAVMNLCGVGSNVGHHLCRWAGRDPDTGKDIAARKGEGVAGA